MSFNKCFVPGCTTGCNVKMKNRRNNPETLKTLFKTPNNKVLFEKWKRNIPRGGVDLIPGCLVCEIHFAEDSIERYIETSMLNGTVCMIKRSKPALKPDAVPTIFPNLPPHLYRTLKRVAPPIANGGKTQKKIVSNTIDNNSKVSKEKSQLNSSLTNDAIQSSNDDIINDSEVTSSQNDTLETSVTNQPKSSPENRVSSSTQEHLVKKVSSVLPIGSIQVPTAKLKELISSQSFEVFADKIKKSLNCKFVKRTPPNFEPNLKKRMPKQECSTPDTTDNFQIIIAEENGDTMNSNETWTYRYLKDNIEDVNVPSWHWSCSFLRNSIAFLEWGSCFEIRKKVIVNYDMKYKVFIMDKEIVIEGFEGPKSFQDLQNFLLIVEKIVICQGIEKGEEKQWSKNCFGFVPPREEGTKKLIQKRCDECVLDMKNAPSVQKRDEEKRLKRIQHLSTALNTEKMKNRGLKTMVQKLRRKVNSISDLLEYQQASTESTTSKVLEFTKNLDAVFEVSDVDVDEDEDKNKNGEGNEAVEESIVDMNEELFIILK